MINISRYLKGEYVYIDPKDKAFALDAKLNFGTMVDNVISQHPGSHIYSVRADGSLLAVVFWYELRPGVAELVTLIDKKVTEHCFSFAKAMKNFINFEIDLYDLRRVQTTLRAEYVEGNRWLSFLGMEKEGTMRAFCSDGTDCELWARVG